MDDSNAPSWKKIAFHWRLLGSLFFVSWLGVILVGGFAWPLGQSQLSMWPWNQSWFMFYRSSGKHYYLQARGTLANGVPAPVSLEMFFDYPSAFHSPRFNESARDVPQLRRLAAFVCRKFNEKAPADGQLERITVWDSWWADQRGMRRRVQEVPAKDVQSWTYVENETCEKLEEESRT